MDKNKIALIGGAVFAGLTAMVTSIFIGKEVLKKMADKKRLEEGTADVEEDA